ncbi:Phenylalanine--tRNA ligase beta subunit [Candidatus Hodgkinia cicadicola]|nr:Phenylalanine--tRNA ligase beta subunit [Candidatus Hodgkinia cicadicola]
MHSVANKSIDFSFLVSALLARGGELELLTKPVKQTNCVFCEIVRCFKARLRSPNCGWYFLLRTKNRFVLSYHSNVIAAKSVVLFCDYSNVKLSKISINGVVCDGFLVTPYDLKLGSTYKRVLLSNFLSKFLLCSTLDRLKLFKSDLITFACAPLLALASMVSFKVSINKTASDFNLLGLSDVGFLTRELAIARAGWCAYRDSSNLLRWFINIGMCMEDNVYDFIVFISIVYNVFVHIAHTRSKLRRSVLNERLLFNEGYVDLTNKTVLTLNERLLSVVGLLDISWFGAVNNSEHLFVIASNSKLKTSLVTRTLGLFILDGSKFSYSLYRNVVFKVRFLFLNFVTTSVYNRLWRRTNLLARIGINVVSVKAILFLKLPAWRLSEKVISSADVWNVELRRTNYINTKPACNNRELQVCIEKNYLDALMLVRQYLSKNNFIELKTSCLLAGQNQNTLNCTPVYGVKSELFVRNSAAASLAVFFSSKNNAGAAGVYETGKLNIFDKSVDFLCVLSNRFIFYYLFRIILRKYFLSWPLVVESVNKNWRVLNLKLDIVCRCGEFFLGGSAENLVYFELIYCNKQQITTTGDILGTVDFVARFSNNAGLWNFIYKLQQFVSFACYVRTQSCSLLSDFVIVVLRLEYYIRDLNLINNCCLLLERFAKLAGGKLVWKC